MKGLRRVIELTSEVVSGPRLLRESSRGTFLERLRLLLLVRRIEGINAALRRCRTGRLGRQRMYTCHDQVDRHPAGVSATEAEYG